MFALDNQLNNQRVVLLGASAGIGLAAAQLLGTLGAEIVIASRTRERLDAALVTLPASAQGYIADLSSESEARRLFAEVGPFDHLVYTAGEALRPFPLDGIDLEDARQFTETRLWGAIGAIKHAHPHMRAGGSIVLTSGSAAARPAAGWIIGAAICGAIEAVTRTLAVELAPLRVNAVAPGIVRTDIWSGMSESDRDDFFAQTAARIPVGRVGAPEDVAQSIAYLISNGYVTGTIAELNGGSNLT
jgi:NAD(P)-dependent dehydrogenase (short-subunit alcohol dehydrogenase family)